MTNQEIAEKIRETAKRLLEEKKVDCVLGYRAGSVPMRERPFFARTPEEAEELTWTSFCNNNLSNFLIRWPKGEIGKVAVVAQGCVSRNLVGLIKENQFARDDIYVIGLSSPGMADRNKVAALFSGKTITEVVENGDKLLVKGRDFTEEVVKKRVMRDNCYTCMHRNPVIYDELIGDKTEDTHGGDLDKVAAPWESLEPEERWAQFNGTVKDCIRCYACRDACPLCYCHVCFVDESKPQWCGKTQDEADVATFHILRAFHCAGRCTDCGACESACPQGIKMRVFTKKIEKDIRALYGYEPGMDEKAVPPMSVYRPDDPQDFIK